ncbi:MAG: deoxynucleoside kinase [Oscillospiraceae bacterium]|nr:deoxynucleoside kinase [Oscillospiraceae bacterium]
MKQIIENGKLIIFEGIDGSGKSSQYRRICERLSSDGIAFRQIVFPRYEKESSALIRLYLGGAFGSHPDDVNAFAASLFYAVDRYASFKDDWGSDYSSGKLIIADRYTTSNIVHQGAKLPENELKDYLAWVSDLEYVKIGLPEPDKVFFLDVDLNTSLRRMKKRQEKHHTSADIHEKDAEYLERCIKTARMACEYFGWTLVPFEKNGTEREITEKNDDIYHQLLSVL